ncbi:MAG: DUF58 domain-containing protein [Vicinamibacteria bacterium]
MPAARLFLACGLVTLVLVGSVAAPWLAWVALAADLALLAAFLLDRARAAAVPLAAARTWPPLLVQGAAATVEVEIRSQADRPVTAVLREALDPALADAPLRARFTIGPRGLHRWRYTLTCRRRGVHTVPPLAARVLGPWGLAWSQRTLLAPHAQRVYPQVRWEGEVGRLLALAHRRELGRAPVRLSGLGSEPYALREYRPGDPPMRIHWKASARHDRLVSREDTWERGARLLILLDCARAMAAQDGGRSKLDHALAAALALTRVAASRGDRVTVMAFSDRIERTVRVRGGARAAGAAYRELFDLPARLVEPAYDLAAEQAQAAESRRALVLVLTSVTDLAAAELLREALVTLRRRHRPLLVNLEDSDLAALALGRPETLEDAFAKVSALAIVLANRRLGRRLQGHDIPVVTAPADRLAWETLDVYLRAVLGARRSAALSRRPGRPSRGASAAGRA